MPLLLLPIYGKGNNLYCYNCLHTGGCTGITILVNSCSLTQHSYTGTKVGSRLGLSVRDCFCYSKPPHFIFESKIWNDSRGRNTDQFLQASNYRPGPINVCTDQALSISVKCAVSFSLQCKKVRPTL